MVPAPVIMARPKRMVMFRNAILNACENGSDICRSTLAGPALMLAILKG
jgi:hypothetical protein